MWLPDRHTDGRTDRRRTKLSQCATGMHVSPAYAWLPRKYDYRTDTQTDGHQTKWSLCAAMLRRRHKLLPSGWEDKSKCYDFQAFLDRVCHTLWNVIYNDVYLPLCVVKLTILLFQLIKICLKNQKIGFCIKIPRHIFSVRSTWCQIEFE